MKEEDPREGGCGLGRGGRRRSSSVPGSPGATCVKAAWADTINGQTGPPRYTTVLSMSAACLPVPVLARLTNGSAGHKARSPDSVPFDVAPGSVHICDGISLRANAPEAELLPWRNGGLPAGLKVMAEVAGIVLVVWVSGTGAQCLPHSPVLCILDFPAVIHVSPLVVCLHSLCQTLLWVLGWQE